MTGQVEHDVQQRRAGRALAVVLVLASSVVAGCGGPDADRARFGEVGDEVLAELDQD